LREKLDGFVKKLDDFVKKPEGSMTGKP